MKKLCVVFGGLSSEHDISVITGMQLSKNLKDVYDVEKIYFGLDNKFYLATQIKDVKYFNNKTEIKLKEVFFNNGSIFYKGLFLKKVCDIDCVINCCHGGVGENGDLAGFFSVLGIKCTSANALASHIAMDKNLAKNILKEIVPTIKGTLITKNNKDEQIEFVKNNFSNSLIVKPNSLGSSIGVKACTKEDFANQVDAIFEMQDSVLVEERIVNISEYNQACYKTVDGLKLSLIEQPLTKSEFLTFDDKYKNLTKAKGTDRIVPANISSELQDLISKYTAQIYEKLNMSGVVRIDYIYDNDSKMLYFNEINTIPGSMAFYLYEPLGIDYISLISDIIDNVEDVKKFTYFDTQILKDKQI